MQKNSMKPTLEYRNTRNALSNCSLEGLVTGRRRLQGLVAATGARFSIAKNSRTSCPV
jgi:hypothetical protein